MEGIKAQDTKPNTKIPLAQYLGATAATAAQNDKYTTENKTLLMIAFIQTS